MANSKTVTPSQAAPSQADMTAALAQAMLAKLGTKQPSDSPLTDWLSDKLGASTNAAARIVAASTVAFSNAGNAYDLEAQVQVARSQKQLRDMAEQAAARILALQ